MTMHRIFHSAIDGRRPLTILLVIAVFGVGAAASVAATNGTAPGAGPASGGPFPPIRPALMTAGDASRLLDQAAFGPTPSDIKVVLSMGASAWVDAQLGTAPTGYASIGYINANSAVGCPTGAPPTCFRDNYTAFPVQRQFFANAVSGADQLRQRVSFAYSQIFVISGVDIKPTYGIRGYQQMLLDNAFINYRQLIEHVTLHPAMGHYLNMVNNDKPNPARGTSPNENYAREVLQLFSIGLNKLNADGTIVRDATGAPVPTYDQDTVEGFAHVFTGWTYAALPSTDTHWVNPENYLGDMVQFDAHHDTAPKLLLNGRTLPSGQTAVKDLSDALDTIYNHPNVGPFIGRQLIEALVTSNPSPAYVTRIATVFKDNGAGIRGDMRAVVRAILLDTEARGESKSTFSYGKLRDPAVYAASVARAFGATTDGVYLNSQTSAMGQSVYAPASVFSFYPPDYALPGSSTLVAPQFGVQNTTTTVGRLNFAYALLYAANGIGADASVPGAIGTRIDLSGYAALAVNPAALVDLLDAQMLHTSLSSPERNSIIAAVNAVPATDALGRTRMAAYLVAVSPRYQITR